MIAPNRRRNVSDPDRLLVRLRNGGEREEVFRQLFQLYYRSVYSCFARRGCCAEECRDLTQETFLRLHRGLEDFRGRSKLETWLYEIAVNVWRNHLRSHSAQKRDVEEVQLGADLRREDDVGSSVMSRNPGQEDELLAKERAKLLRRELEKMPPQMRRCIQLRLDQELKFREIAVLMKISIDTVKSQLAQAKQRIRLGLGEYFSVERR